MTNNEHESLYSAHAERSVLGAVMIDAKAYERADVAPDDFASEAHREIWRAVMRLRDQGEPADPVTISERGGGDLAYLGEIANEVSSAANVTAYAAIVRDLSLRRSAVTAATTMSDSVRDRSRGIDEAIDEAQQAVLSLSVSTQASRLAPMADYIAPFLDDVERRMEAEGGLLGVATGHTEVDSLIQGFEPGDLVVVAGRPAMGKTLLVEQWCEHIAETSGKPVAFFSLEMPANQLMRRSAARNAHVPLSALRDGKLEDHHWRTLSESMIRLRHLPLYIDDTAGLTISDLRSRARSLHQRQPLSAVAVDYVQILQAGDLVSSQARADQKIAAVVTRLKWLAKELGIPVIAVAQLNREVDKRTDKRPHMSDLREAGQIEQDADVIAFIYREEEYEPETPRHGVAEVIVRKQRNGPSGTAHLAFLGEYQAFEDLSGAIPEAMPANVKGARKAMEY